MGKPTMKLFFFYILLLSSIIVCTLSLPILPGKFLINSSHGIAQEIRPFVFESQSHPSNDNSNLVHFQKVLLKRSDLPDDPMVLADDAHVFETFEQSDVFHPTESSTEAHQSTPPPITNPIITPLIVAACVFFVIFLAVLIGFTWIICRYGRGAKLDDDEENTISKSISVGKSISMSRVSSVDDLKPVVVVQEQLTCLPSSRCIKEHVPRTVSLPVSPIERSTKQAATKETIINNTSISQAPSRDDLKPTSREEEQIPRTPSSKRFKRYACGRVPLGVGPVSTSSPSKHSKKTSRKPSPLHQVISAPSVSIIETNGLPRPSMYAESVSYTYSDSSSISVNMPPTPDLDDEAVRRELFDLDDPFAPISPYVSLDSPCDFKAPDSEALAVSTEQHLSEAYDSCYIIGEYADTDDEAEDHSG